jgi:hypothetical protein
MSESITNTEDQNPVTDSTELIMLKQRAQLLGIQHSNNISAATLREKINKKLEASEAVDQTKADVLIENEDPVNPLQPVPEKKKTFRQITIAENMRLIRCRITNLDPKKKDLPGEIFTVANEYLGTVRKYVPFGEVTDDGFHVPYCIYKMMDNRKFLNLRTRKLPNGQTRIEQSWAKEFALEILPQLTPAEISKLATAQAAAGTLNDDG